MEKKGKLELTWVGKYEEEKLEPRILIEDKSKSYGDPDTENMLIHGDNLLALKALERDYAGKIKCVYIDPPYNTGNAFEHYDDDVEHSLWLNMIYKRVQILHKLLSKDGTLWMSIDSTEGHYLKVMCDEIFGRSNFVSDITYEKSNVTGLGQGGAIFNTGEKLLVYKKETVELNEVLATEKLTKKTMQRYRKYIKSEGRRELVDEFESASNSLNEMLEELFMFTKLKNESYSLELTLCCMNRILKETVFSYYDEWVRMEIQPDIQITEEQLYIHGNRQGLCRVIQNVIKNGLDHGEKKISIVLERDQNQAVLRISNQVTHPEQINIDQVFERFYKADVARSKTSTGLGLSIAKELVSRMDGEIEAKIEKKEFIVEMNFPIVTDAK